MVVKEIGVTKAREVFSSIIKDVQYQSAVYIITRHGEKVAAIVPVQVYQVWEKQRKSFFDQIREIQEKTDLGPQEASQLAAEAVAAVRSVKDQTS